MRVIKWCVDDVDRRQHPKTVVLMTMKMVRVIKWCCWWCCRKPVLGNFSNSGNDDIVDAATAAADDFVGSYYSETGNNKNDGYLVMVITMIKTLKMMRMMKTLALIAAAVDEGQDAAADDYG